MADSGGHAAYANCFPAEPLLPATRASGRRSAAAALTRHLRGMGVAAGMPGRVGRLRWRELRTRHGSRRVTGRLRLFMSRACLRVSAPAAGLTLRPLTALAGQCRPVFRTSARPSRSARAAGRRGVRTASRRAGGGRAVAKLMHMELAINVFEQGRLRR